MKPVAAGVAVATGRNEDVDALAAASSVDAPLRDRNPFSFHDAVAPHLAARREGRRIDVGEIREAFLRLSNLAEAVVIEGAGGALVPLDDRLDMLDIARALDTPVLLVVGMRLGCLNHARLSALAIRARGLRLAGWVASRLDPSMEMADENVGWLARELAVPLVAQLRDAKAPPFERAALSALELLSPTRKPA
jgi:dethiobiotin synthetase